MQGFVYREPAHAEVEDVPDPELAEDGLIVQPVVSGVCGTDVHMFYEGTLTRADRRPVVMGHEFVGRVVEIGPKAFDALPYPDGGRPQVGDLVGVEPMLPCGRCPSCLRGRPNLCRDWGHLGILDHGSWADYVAVPGRRTVRISPQTDPRAAGLLEPLACAVNFVLERGQVRAGDRVVIFGGGPIGLLCAQVAVAAGAEVAVVEPNPTRRDLATRIGAHHVVAEPSPDAVAEALSAEVVIEASGHPSALTAAIAVAPAGGRVVLAGLGSGAPVPLDMNLLVQKELEVRGGFASRWAFGRALALIESGRVDTAALISQTVPWQQARDVIERLHAGRPDICKVLLLNEEAA